MEANELRLGNYLKARNGSNYEITTVDGIMADETIFVTINKIDHVKRHVKRKVKVGTDEMNDIEPIPLTEDWLLNFGLNTHLLDSKGDEYHVVEAMDLDESISWPLYRNNERLVNLKYVHQLQNLYFALTGEELTIKYPAR